MPVTRLLFAAIVSKTVSSAVFLIIISPSPALTFSSNVRKILAVFDTFKSLSAGELDERVGAAVQEEGTLWPHLGSCEDVNRELVEKFIGAVLTGKCETSKQVKSWLYFDAFWRNCLSRLLLVLFLRDQLLKGWLKLIAVWNIALILVALETFQLLILLLPPLLNARAERNMLVKSVTSEVSHEPISWLNLRVFLNIWYIVKTFDVFQPPISWLNFLAPRNIVEKDRALPVSQPLMSWSNFWAL